MAGIAHLSIPFAEFTDALRVPCEPGPQHVKRQSVVSCVPRLSNYSVNRGSMRRVRRRSLRVTENHCAAAAAAAAEGRKLREDPGSRGDGRPLVRWGAIGGGDSQGTWENNKSSV